MTAQSRSMIIQRCDALLPTGVANNVTIEITDGVITSISDAVDRVKPANIAETHEVIDASGLVAMPGLINSHTHAAMTLLRGVAEDVPVDAWFNDYVWPMEVNVTAEDVYLGTQLACAEMVRAGITNFADHYFFADSAARAVSESGLRANLGMTFFSSQGEGGLETSIEFAERWHGQQGGRITASIAPHATYTCTDDHLLRSAEAARRLGVRVHIHAAEHLEQTRSSIEQRGITPIEVLHQTGVLDAGVIIAHGCGILEPDIETLAGFSDRVGVAHCPKVYLKHGLDPLTPIKALLESGVAVGLGTDGPAGCNSIDIFENMRLTALTQKFISRDPTWMSTAQSLDLAGPGSARSVGSNGGRLEVGADGDVILVDLARLHSLPVHDPAAALVYSAQAGDVRTTIVGGVPLMVDGELLTIDVDGLLERVAARSPQLSATDHGTTVQTYDP